MIAHARYLSLFVCTAVALPASPASAVDLNGKWLLNGNKQQFVQSGSSLSFGPFVGTVTVGSPFSTYQVATPGGELEIRGRISPSSDLLDGLGIQWAPPVAVQMIGTRCTCDDGNTTNGDGCSADCRIEPCWSCTGDPSVCTPTPDGGFCEDGTVCTTGETCSGGTCGGGTWHHPCVDMTGTWSVHRVMGDTSSDFVQEAEQIGTDLILGGRPGIIDPVMTGEFDVRAANTDIYCPYEFVPLTGTAAADGQSYTASGYVVRSYVIGAHHFCETTNFTETGVRCGDGECSTTTTTTSSTTTTTIATGTECAVAPVAGCRQPVAPRKAKLALADRTPDYGDAVSFKWTKGAATSLADLGDPTAVTSYVGCLYDGSGALQMTLRMPAGGTCATRPCWKASAKGFIYTDKDGASDGVTKLSLLSGAAGKSKVTLAARHSRVPMPALGGFGSPVRFQLQANYGCWEAAFSEPQVSTPLTYKALSD